MVHVHDRFSGRKHPTLRAVDRSKTVSGEKMASRSVGEAVGLAVFRTTVLGRRARAT